MSATEAGPYSRMLTAEKKVTEVENRNLYLETELDDALDVIDDLRDDLARVQRERAEADEARQIAEHRRDWLLNSNEELQEDLAKARNGQRLILAKLDENTEYTERLRGEIELKDDVIGRLQTNGNLVVQALAGFSHGVGLVLYDALDNTTDESDGVTIPIDIALHLAEGVILSRDTLDAVATGRVEGSET